MEYILFAVYLVLFAWIVTRTSFFTKSGLSKPQLVILFFLKVIAGIFYGWMGHFYGNFAQMVDTWNYHRGGLEEYQLLFNEPHIYLTNLFHNSYNTEGLDSFFGSKNSYWNDLKANVFIKVLSIFDIFSLGHYYVNVVFYSFLSLFGPMASYRVMTHAFPSKKNIILITTFLVPSFLYWSSGLHKEGLIFTAIALIVYHIYFAKQEGKWRLKRILGVMLGLVTLLLLRNFVLALILPAITGWLIANRWPRYNLAIYFGIYLTCFVAFFGLRYLSPALDFPKAVVDKQQAFVALVGNSSIPIRELEPNLVSFIKCTPQAITLSAARPYPSDVHHLLSLSASVETNLILLLVLLFLLFRLKNLTPARNLVYFCVFFSITLLLSIGFSVNNLGAIVRYRSIIIPLVVTLMAVYTDWARIFRLAGHFKKNNNLNN